MTGGDNYTRRGCDKEKRRQGDNDTTRRGYKVKRRLGEEDSRTGEDEERARRS